MQLKLDELLRAMKAARTSLVNVEELSDSELDALQRQFARLSKASEKQGAGPSVEAKKKRATPPEVSDGSRGEENRNR